MEDPPGPTRLLRSQLNTRLPSDQASATHVGQKISDLRKSVGQALLEVSLHLRLELHHGNGLLDSNRNLTLNIGLSILHQYNPFTLPVPPSLPFQLNKHPLNPLSTTQVPQLAKM